MFFLVSAIRHRRRAPAVIRASTELRRELGRRQIAKARVRPHLVVVLSPLLDPDLRVQAVPKPLEAQKLVAEFSVEGFVGGILSRLPRIDQRRVNARVAEPAQDGGGHELRPVVRPPVPRRAVHADELREDLDHPTGADAAGHVNR